MRVLITGGFGFIGGRLGQFLSEAGYEVVLGSRKAYEPPVWLSQARVAKIDWASDKSLANACEGIDAVIHAAGVNTQDCAKNPTKALAFNGLATARILDASIEKKVKHFSYLSTAHVYASPLTGIFTEESCPDNLHPYATSHLAGENVLLRAIEKNKIEGSVLRLSNAFGAPAHREVNCWMLLANDLCRQVAENKEMVLKSSGGQKRDFITITDICRAIEFQLKNTVLSSSSIINLGSGQSSSVMQMANLIQQRCKIVLGFEPDLTYPDPLPMHLEATEVLEYRHDCLSEIGFSIKNDNKLEIDTLLNNCNTWFKANLV